MMDLVPSEIAQETGKSVINLGTLASMTTVGFAALGHETLRRPWRLRRPL